MFKKFILKKLIWLLVIALLVWLFPTVMKYIAIISGLIIYLAIGFAVTLINDDELSERIAENSSANPSSRWAWRFTSEMNLL